MKKYSYLINKGVAKPLQNVAFHNKEKAPLKRWEMFEKRKINQKGVKITAHIIKKIPKKFRNYTELHKHKYDEINLILSERGKLVYRIQIEDEVYIVKSPASVYIPKGLRHSANVLSGEGIFVADIFVSPYEAFK
ncbi:2-isopropylmalate synthase [Candidatus Pacearchaeota archaeon]|nr:2-isopropylmalate synthase [Candidatus Pacearchaeota archaeon]